VPLFLIDLICMHCLCVYLRNKSSGINLCVLASTMGLVSMQFCYWSHNLYGVCVCERERVC
jgi:hypothetical protein